MAVTISCGGNPKRYCGLMRCHPNNLPVQSLIAALLLALTATMVTAEWYGDNQAVMGTSVSVTLWHEDSAAAEAAVAAVIAEMRRLDNALSPYKDDSELSRINREAGRQPVKLSAEMLALLDKSLYYSQLSEGAFDISFASLGQHYDYRQKRQPSDRQLDQLLAAIDYRMIRLNTRDSTVRFLHPQLQIDLGGIAKGYAVDRAIAILQQRGINHATVSAGGDSRVLGDKRGRPWIVGIKNPRQEGKMSILLPLENVAISTSGDYERFFIEESSGERIHHILNPRTGRSASGVISVSILGPRGFDTDPLSTTVFVLGLEKGMQLLKQMPGYDAIIIDAEGQVHYSDGLTPPAP